MAFAIKWIMFLWLSETSSLPFIWAWYFRLSPDVSPIGDESSRVFWIEVPLSLKSWCLQPILKVETPKPGSFLATSIHRAMNRADYQPCPGYGPFISINVCVFLVCPMDNLAASILYLSFSLALDRTPRKGLHYSFYYVLCFIPSMSYVSFL